MSKTKLWYERDYEKSGLNAQRLYPNEELLRFLGRNYFGITNLQERTQIKILELGCGSGANLWMLAKEGFDTFGIDIAKNALEFAKQMFIKWGVNANLKPGSFTDLPYADNSFDSIVDVFSIYCLNDKDFLLAIEEVVRILRPGGLFFSYTPSIESDAFINYSPSEKIDKYTLNGIHRRTSPYFGNNYPFHFISNERYEKVLSDRNLHVDYNEIVMRSYNKGTENFQHVVISAKKR